MSMRISTSRSECIFLFFLILDLSMFKMTNGGKTTLLGLLRPNR